jgi:hypothetical protein
VVAGIVREDLQGDGLEEVVQLADVLVARQGALVNRIQFVTVVADPVVGPGSNAPREIQNVTDISRRSLTKAVHHVLYKC